MLMHPLVPGFILNACAAGKNQGSFSAFGLFMDISGFSTMTDSLMAYGQHGAEVMAEIMRAVMDPLIDCVFEQGGFVASSAGDAITALFPFETSSAETACRALAAACAIQKHMQMHGDYRTEYKTFHVSAKVGLAEGQVSWGILYSETGRRGVYYFQGSAVDGCAEAEHHAKAGDIVLDRGITAHLGNLVVVEPVEQYYRANKIAGDLPSGQTVQPYAGDLQVIARFYPENVVTQILSGEFRQVVSMFISLPSVRTEKQLSIFVETMFALQDKYGGLLNRLDFGDKGTNVLLFWGAPVAYENDIQRALNFILDLQTLTSIPISAGVTYRISHAGYSGGRMHEEYTCLGRGVNLAARFMTSAPRGEIWVDAPTAERAGSHFELDFVKEETFKGFSTPQKVFALLERKEDVETIFQGLLTGRMVDLEKLQKFVGPIFTQAFAGMLVITGEPGMGKSRLVYEFLEHLKETAGQDFQVFLGQTDEIVRESFNPLTYWLRQYFGITNAQGEARSKRAFNRKVDDLIAVTADRHLADEIDRTRSFIGALLGLYWSDSLYEQLDAEGRYQNTLIGLTSILQAESLQLPVILLLEDIHWLDHDSRAFLSRLLRLRDAQRGWPIAILCTARNEGNDLVQEEWVFDELPLTGLQNSDLQELAASKLNAPISTRLLQILSERSEGNPFYAEQIVRYLQEENLLVLEQGAWTIKLGNDNLLPTNVNVLLIARLDNLSRQVKEAVQTASVLGREFDLRPLIYMLRRERGTIPEEVMDAERASVWSSLSEMHYIFNHTMLRDAAYQMQVHTRRKMLHGVAVAAFENLYAGNLLDHYGELAYHTEQAGMGKKAVHYLRLAANKAYESFQNSQAIEYYTRALALVEESDIAARYELLLGRESVNTRLSRNDDRNRDLQELHTLLSQLADLEKEMEIILRQAKLAIEMSEYAKVLAYSGQVIQYADSVGKPELAARAYSIIAGVHFRQGNLAEAEKNAGQSLLLAQEAHSLIEEMNSLDFLGLIFINVKKLDEAQAYLVRGLQIAEENEHWTRQTSIINNMGMISGMRGNYIDSQKYYQRSLQLTRKTGDRTHEAIVLGNLGFVSGQLGQYARAKEFLEQQIRITNSIGLHYYEAYGHVNLAACLIALGNFEDAKESSQKALEFARRINDRSGEGWALTYLGHACLASTDLGQAIDAYARALKIREELTQPELATEPAAGLARAALIRGDIEAARAYLRPVLALLEIGKTLEGTDEPLRVYLTCYLVLKELDDPHAHGLLKTAYEELMDRAWRIPDENTRQAFLNNVEHHREVYSAWEQAA
jgi:predicted ATPase